MTDSLTDKLQVLFPEIEPRTVLDCTVIDIDPQAVPQVMERLKTYPDLGFSLLLDITAIDYLTYPQKPAARFCVVYTLRNWERNHLLTVPRDPANGYRVALPRDSSLKEELCAHQFKAVGRQISVDSKDRVKEELGRSWDVHAERVIGCTDCHYSLNNPVYFQESDESQPDHLIFDPRRIDQGEYLYRPLHQFAKGQSAQGTVDQYELIGRSSR